MSTSWGFPFPKSPMTMKTQKLLKLTVSRRATVASVERASEGQEKEDEWADLTCVAFIIRPNRYSQSLTGVPGETRVPLQVAGIVRSQVVL